VQSVDKWHFHLLFGKETLTVFDHIRAQYLLHNAPNGPPAFSDELRLAVEHYRPTDRRYLRDMLSHQLSKRRFSMTGKVRRVLARPDASGAVSPSLPCAPHASVPYPTLSPRRPR
jgi:hypothetical protein